MVGNLTVKICGICELEIAELALELGADFLGCILHEKSPRYMSEGRVEAVFSNLPEGQRVAVVVRPNIEELQKIQKLPLDYYQIHFDPETDRALIKDWAQFLGKDRLWLAPKIKPEQTFPLELLDYADTFVVDSYSKDQFGGTGSTGSWSRFEDFSKIDSSKRWILAGGLSPDNVLEAIEQTSTQFIDVNSGVESSPGVKSKEKIRELFANLKQ